MSPLRILAAVCLSLAILPPAGAYADVIERHMGVQGRILDIVTADLDGDRLEDLVVLSVAGPPSRERRLASFFYQRPGRRFQNWADIRWELPTSIVAMDEHSGGETAGDPASLYALGADGVQLLEVDRAGGTVLSSPVVRVALPHLIPQRDSVLVTDFARSWTGRGAEFLVPAFPSALLLRVRPGGLFDSIPFPVSPTASYGGGGFMEADFEFPASLSTDQDGDGSPEIVLRDRHQIAVLDLEDPEDPGESAGSESSPATPQMRVFPVEILTESEALLDEHDVRRFLTDLDGDGRADLVAVAYRSTGRMEFDGRIMVFKARADGSLGPKADQVIEVPDGIYYMTFVGDLDGDGSKEIVVPSASLGVWGIIRVLTTRKVSFQFNTYRARADGLFEPGMVTVDEMTIRLSDRYELPILRFADANGDGIRDLVIGVGEDKACVHDGEAGSTERRFSKRQSLCFETNPFDDFEYTDLDGDRRDELIRLETAGDGRGRFSVFFLDG